MSGAGEREDAPEIEPEEIPEVETEAEEGAEETEDPQDEEEQPEDPVEGGEGEQAAATAAKPRSAATIAVQEAKRAAKEAKAEAEASRRELEQLRQERQGAQTAEQQRLEAERLALMPPEEKYEFLLNKQRQETNARIGALEFRTHDTNDRVAFESACLRVPAYAAIQKDVEAALAQARREGNNPLRETVAKYLIGERAVAKALGGAAQRQKTKGRENIARQTTKPAAGRSDVVRGSERAGADSAAARKSRLENMDI